MIQAIRFVKPASLGQSAVPVEHFIVGRTSIDGTVTTATFDADDRYVRMSYAGKTYFDLIPVHNIASIQVIPDIAKKVSAKE